MAALFLLTRVPGSGADKTSPDRRLSFFMESHVMRNRLHIKFRSLHLTADGIVAIAAALIIVILVLAASRF
jgi:hypothetical protein